ncbi:phosphatidylinositol-4- kinase [Boothiomyces sp. JEL0866]|nr:phosphatidylinositol-4- kinase [Boothiomyces sp. JEL0866]
MELVDLLLDRIKEILEKDLDFGFNGFCNTNCAIMQKYGSSLLQFTTLVKNVELQETYLDAMRWIAASYFSENTFSNIWEDLQIIEMEVPKIDQQFQKCLEGIDSYCRGFERNALGNKSIVYWIQISVISAVLLSKTAECADFLQQILEETSQEYDLDIYLSCIEGLGIIGNFDPHLRAKICNLITIFLLDPAPVFKTSKSNNCIILRECSSNILTLILDSLSRTGADSSLKKSTLFLCINTMHSNSKDSKKYENSISAIANLTRVLKPKETIEIAIPALVRKLEEIDDEEKSLIWDALGNIGITSDLEIFKCIISFTLSSNIAITKISKIAHTLARMPGRPLALLEMYLEKLLEIFMEKAIHLQKSQDQSRVNDLRDLVNLIRVICENEELASSLISEQNPEIIHQLRNMYPILKIIARKSPPLILEKKRHSLQISSKIKPILTGYLPARAIEIRNLSFPVAVYLVTVYQLERLRMKTLSLDFICGYLLDERLHATETYLIVENIADSILKQAIRDSSYRLLNETIVEGHLKTLLLFAANRIQKIRKFVGEWIKKILQVCPKMFYNKTSVNNMLDILRFLDNEKASYKETSFDFTTQLFYTSEYEACEAALDFYNLAKDWIESSLKISAGETIGILMNYVAQVSRDSPWMNLSQNSFTLPKLPGTNPSLLMTLFQQFFANALSANMIKYTSKRMRYYGEVYGMISAYELIAATDSPEKYSIVGKKLCKELRKTYKDSESPHFIQNLHTCLSRCAAFALISDIIDSEIVQLLCYAPQIKFTRTVMELVVETLSWIMTGKPSLSTRILSQLAIVWETIAQEQKGIYDVEECAAEPFEGQMTYGKPQRHTKKDFDCRPHCIWIEFLIERFKIDRLLDVSVSPYTNFILMACSQEYKFSTSLKAYEGKLDLLSLGFRIAKELTRRNDKSSLFVWTAILTSCTDFFSTIPLFGDISKTEMEKILVFYNSIKSLKFDKVATLAHTSTLLKSAFCPSGDDRVEFQDVQQLLVILWEQEINRFACWIKPLSTDEPLEFVIPPPVNEKLVKWHSIIRTAWRVNSDLAIQLKSRFPASQEIIDADIAEIARNSEIRVCGNSHAVSIFLKNSWRWKTDHQLRHLLYWESVPPITAIHLLNQSQKLLPWVIQYAIRSLEAYPIKQVFFYIPQLVQALRNDTFGYVERFILEAAKTSQYFAHQIIWNMEANMYKDDSCEVPDALKPTLDRIIDKIIKSLTGSDKEFYEREFSFFKEITDISGKLKPLVHANASKAEKKKKIDEELRKIKVDIGVYLPTNPDGTVVDIDYDSGRPMQSHAKAPFLCTFEVANSDSFDEPRQTERMSSIFKVGDDCRQDVLALQLISVFQSIFNAAGLDLYTFPYRVVATAPGCGVIEVIPQSMSRDMMGREKVNSLADWFTAEFGPEQGVAYQNAQNEFVKSLAAYSVIMFLLQIKDRHNGNIMFDKQGHMVHIDFGFMLSIAPGGGILEVSPFKLTTEMIAVMGGDALKPAYVKFSELCIKAYLAARQHSEEIINMVQLMLDSGLPCFKGELTIKKLRERFQLDKSDRQAADFMIYCIKQSHENTRSGLYDRFQYMQNGIPF